MRDAMSPELKGDMSAPPESIPSLVVHEGGTYSVKFDPSDSSRLITAGHDRSHCVGIGKLVKLLSANPNDYLMCLYVLATGLLVYWMFTRAE